MEYKLGSTFGMVDQALKLSKASCNLFIADLKSILYYSPSTVLFPLLMSYLDLLRSYKSRERLRKRFCGQHSSLQSKIGLRSKTAEPFLMYVHYCWPSCCFFWNESTECECYSAAIFIKQEYFNIQSYPCAQNLTHSLEEQVEELTLYFISCCYRSWPCKVA